MSERPMLFSTPMVEAILADRKTQTRRLVKEIPLDAPYFEVVDGVPMACDQDGEWWPAERFSRIQPGDILWVRETWQHLFDHRGWRYEYKADYKDDEPLRLGGMNIAWRPSIYMPKEAARLFLRVENVRMEHLHKIMDAPTGPDNPVVKEGCTYGFEFIAIWDNTIKPAERTRYGWNADPWVWVYDFERIKNGRA